MLREDVMELAEEWRKRRGCIFAEVVRCRTREVLGPEVRSWMFVALPRATLRSV